MKKLNKRRREQNRKAARKSLASKTGAINPNNLTQLKRVLDKQKPKRTK